MLNINIINYHREHFLSCGPEKKMKKKRKRWNKHSLDTQLVYMNITQTQKKKNVTGNLVNERCERMPGRYFWFFFSKTKKNTKKNPNNLKLKHFGIVILWFFLSCNYREFEREYYLFFFSLFFHSIHDLPKCHGLFFS